MCIFSDPSLKHEFKKTGSKTTQVNFPSSLSTGLLPRRLGEMSKCFIFTQLCIFFSIYYVEKIMGGTNKIKNDDLASSTPRLSHS